MSEDQEKYAVTGREEGAMGLITKQAQVSMFLNEQRFEFAQRIGKMLSASTMVPEHFKNNLGNCLIALNMSERLGIDVFGLMQTSYVVHGRPGFEAKLLIALFNSRTDLFIPPLRWEMKGNFPKGKDAACRAYARDKETKDMLYGEWIDYDMIEGEGWNTDKENRNGGITRSKWNTIPGQMFRYRAASFFINVYEPGLKMGIQTVDELEDMMIDVTPQRAEILPPPAGVNPLEVKPFPEDGTQAGPGEEKTVEPDPVPPVPLFEELKGMRPSTSPENMKTWKDKITLNADKIRAFPEEQYKHITKKWSLACPGEPFPARPKTGEEETKDRLYPYVSALGTDGVDDVLRHLNPPITSKIVPDNRWEEAKKALKQAVDMLPPGDEAIEGVAE
jgi:hypothetical protein